MTGKDKTLLVYDDFSADAPILLGKLYVGVIKGGESYSFEYGECATLMRSSPIL